MIIKQIVTKIKMYTLINQTKKVIMMMTMMRKIMKVRKTQKKMMKLMWKTMKMRINSVNF